MGSLRRGPDAGYELASRGAAASDATIGLWSITYDLASSTTVMPRGVCPRNGTALCRELAYCEKCDLCTESLAE